MFFTKKKERNIDRHIRFLNIELAILQDKVKRLEQREVERNGGNKKKLRN